MILVAALFLLGATQEKPRPADPLLRLQGDDQPVLSVSFFPDGKRLLSGGGSIRIWEIPSGRERRRLEIARPDSAVMAQLSGDGRRIAALEPLEMVVRIWETESGDEIIQLFTDYKIPLFAFAPDGSAVAAGSGLTVHDLRDFRKQPAQVCERGVTAAVYSPDGTLLAGAQEGRIQLWDSKSGRPLRVLEPLEGRTDALLFTRDGGTLMAVSDQAGVSIWNAASGKCRGTLALEETRTRESAASIDGALLATLSETREIVLWETASGKPIFAVGDRLESGMSLALSPDGTFLALGTRDGKILVWAGWNAASAPVRMEPGDYEASWARLADVRPERAWQALRSLAASGPQAAAFLRDRLLATPAPKDVEAWIAALDDAEVSTRSAAREKLAGGLHDPAVWKSLEASSSAEVRSQLPEFARSATSLPVRSPELLRRCRAVAALERLDARESLREIAKGTPQALQVQAAKAALDRLAK
jgi:hypothetical protein